MYSRLVTQRAVPVLSYLAHRPHVVVPEAVHLAEDAYVIGRVTLAGAARLEEGAVLRGDQSAIEVGPRFRIGHRSTVHVEGDGPTRLGADVWVGDDAVVHGCTLGDGVRVEDGGIVLSRGTVGTGSIVAADSLVPEGVTFGDNSLIRGTPGRRERDTTPEERAETLRRTALL